MQAELPIYEGPEDALKAAVQAAGGAKAVGSLIWPDKSVETARDLLLNCLNPNRPEKLDYSQAIFVFRLAREKGFHAGFDYFAHECGYEARPITKAEEADRLVNVIENAAKVLATAIPALERIQRDRTIKVAA